MSEEAIWELGSAVQERKSVIICKTKDLEREGVLAPTAYQAERKLAEGTKQYPPRLEAGFGIQGERLGPFFWFGSN